MKFLERPVNWLAAALLMSLVVLSNWAVVQRYLIGRPLHFTEEVSGLLLIWIVMIGAIAAERDDQHLTISVFVDMLPDRAALVVNTVIGTLSVIVLVAVAWIGIQLTGSVSTRITQILRIPYYWIYIAFPIGCGGIIVYMIHRNISNIRQILEGRRDG